MYTSSNSTPAAVLSAVATIAAVGLLLLVAVDRGSILAWATVPLPLVLAAGAAYFASRAARHGNDQSALDLISLGLAANVVVACLAGLLG